MNATKSAQEAFKAGFDDSGKSLETHIGPKDVGKPNQTMTAVHLSLCAEWHFSEPHQPYFSFTGHDVGGDASENARERMGFR
ncbi:hypothetical protein DOTSEDRAFT_74218 [Dothistroma septosporum NZE10]|uniref:Uncharacterized protein n=1 Tax=Dothistroma septosporum (strain NZE10 / CBS 128990) TaxID=675120 RepID=N1PE06_DOTSN|nr:hypothetical protein DOTSEDRAFT_74218 [Dothistroma septosporum NZE10]